MSTTTQTRGLGKGLSALISENSSKPSANSSPAVVSGINHVPHTRLHPGQFQPRTHFDEGALTELAESIQKNGIMQPIIVRPGAGSKLEIVAGERRWRAAKLAGLETVPVIIREISNKQALELALVENIQRRDLGPLEEALGYQRLIEEFDYTQEELAGTVGKSRSHIANLLRLLSLPDEVKTMLEKGELTMGHARALLTSENPVELARQIAKKGLNVRQAESFSKGAGTRVKETSEKSARPKAPAAYRHPQDSGAKDPDILALEETLSENLGLKVSIYDRGQSGEIVLSYDSLSQLDEILKRLGEGY
ncbi:MAG: ParB/RepB/Spo0J family partition protein [Alphaproteobacteria bacterium]|nr:ParB/RepB/Spo0J family partition protein [Alphaproteobacteria bacterium]